MLEKILKQLAELEFSIGFEIGIAIAIFLGIIIMGKVFVRFILKKLLRLAKKTSTNIDTKILLAFEKPLQWFVVILAIYFAIGYLSLDEGYSLLLSRFFRSSLIIFFAAGFYNLTGDESFLFNELKSKLNLEVDKILVPFLSKVTRVLVVILALTMVAQEWKFDVNGFLTGLGLGGLAFALAAKDTVSNLFGGIVIITDKPFSIGDWIDTPSVEGTVEDINFRSTKVRTFAHAVVTVPNATLANQPITNWTRMGKRRISFHLGVTYSTTREKIQKCIREIREMLQNHDGIHKETIFVHFDSFSESSLDIFIYCFTLTTRWGEFLEVKEDVNLKIMEVLEKEEVSVAFPSRSIYMETPAE